MGLPERPLSLGDRRPSFIGVSGHLNALGMGMRAGCIGAFALPFLYNLVEFNKQISANLYFYSSETVSYESAYEVC